MELILISPYLSRITRTFLEILIKSSRYLQTSPWTLFNPYTFIQPIILCAKQHPIDLKLYHTLHKYSFDRAIKKPSRNIASISIP